MRVPVVQVRVVRAAVHHRRVPVEVDMRLASIVCFALVTNIMGQHGGDDIEKGEADSTVAAMRLIAAAARAFRNGPRSDAAADRGSKPS